MDTLAAFFLGVLSSYWFLGLSFLFLLVYEYKESGVAYMFFLLTTLCLIVIFNITIPGWTLLAYLPIGFAWSLWRYKKFVAKKLAINYEYAERNNLELSGINERQLTVKENLDRITHWIMLWPINMMMHLSADLWEAVGSFITNRLSNVYNSILQTEKSKYTTKEEE